MVEFGKVAELVRDNVISDVWWKEHYFIIEIEISFLGTTAPAGFVVLYKNLPERQVVISIEMLNACMDKSARMFPHL